jgi:hypothetical protein
MKRCDACASENPAAAKFCMQCGRALPDVMQTEQPGEAAGGIGLFALSLAGSVLISVVLMFVFNIPIFFLAGFLPLLWLNRKK